MFLTRFWGAKICFNKVVFARVWKDAKDTKNKLQVGQSHKQSYVLKKFEIINMHAPI